jgi:hypothetical protein
MSKNYLKKSKTQKIFKKIFARCPSNSVKWSDKWPFDGRPSSRGVPAAGAQRRRAVGRPVAGENRISFLLNFIEK